MDDLFPPPQPTTLPLFPRDAPAPFVRVIDVETAGRRLEEDAVIEIGSADLDLGSGLIGNPMQTLSDPAGVEIDPRARRVHGITDEMLQGAPPFGEAVRPFAGAAVYAAQRAEFDRSRLRLSGRWLCTWKLALRAFPDLPAHGLQSLVKYVPLDLAEVRPLLEPLHPHRALYDALCTAVLLRAIARALMPRCCDAADFLQRAERVSAEPALLARLRFGRHKGVPLAQVPADYLEWLVNEPDMDRDAVFSARRQLERLGQRGVREAPALPAL